jgi:hypothetical protein
MGIQGSEGREFLLPQLLEPSNVLGYGPLKWDTGNAIKFTHEHNRTSKIFLGVYPESP